MAESKHTPGPWRTDAEVEHQGVLGPDGYMVADCAIFSMHKGAPTSERCTANARLIASAPGMADMIRDLLSLHEAHHNHPLHAAARLLLAKARGGLDA